MESNGGRQRGATCSCCYVFANGNAVGEILGFVREVRAVADLRRNRRAEVEGRDASLDVAFAGFDSDPFKFDRHPVNLLFAFWRSGDGRLHVQSGSLRFFFSLAAGRHPN